MRLRYALGVALWESLCHVLHIDHMRVFAVPARIVVAAYAFVVLVFCNTYLANLAAFLTADRLKQEASSLREAFGQTVGTYPVFQDAIQNSFGLTTIPIPAAGNGAPLLADLHAGLCQLVRGNRMHAAAMNLHVHRCLRYAAHSSSLVTCKAECR